MSAMEAGRPPTHSRGRRVWRRASTNAVTRYIAERQRACERVDLGAVRAMLVERARTAGIPIEDVDAVMRDVEVPGDHTALTT